MHRGDRVWVLSGKRKEAIGRRGLVRHTDVRMDKTLVWVRLDEEQRSICFRSDDLTTKSPLELLAEQADD